MSAYVAVEYGEPEERGDRVEYAEELGWGSGWYGDGEGMVLCDVGGEA